LCHVSRLSIFFFVPQQPNVGVDRLQFMSLDHTQLDTHTHTPVGLLCTSDQFVAQAATTQHTTNTTTSSARFEPAVPTIKRPQSYALDGVATGIGV